MKKFMEPKELARDDRFERSDASMDFLLDPDITPDQIEENFLQANANQAVKDRIEERRASGNSSSIFKRLRPTSRGAPLFIKGQMHGILVGEMQALEAAGRSAWDYVDNDELPWKFQLDMARQAWDEARHVEIYSALLDHVDCELGEFPENTFLFEFGCSDDPAERVVGINRCLEGLALDVFEDTMKFGERAEDETIWRSVDYVAADEVTHVRFGQVWSKELTATDPERRKQVVSFQRKVDRVFSLATARGTYDGNAMQDFLPIAEELRRLAGFSDEEIEEVGGIGPEVFAAD